MSVSAGSMMSIDIAVIDIKSAISAMNSRNGRGNRAAVESEMGAWGRFKRAYLHYGRQAGGFRGVICGEGQDRTPGAELAVHFTKGALQLHRSARTYCVYPYPAQR